MERPPELEPADRILRRLSANVPESGRPQEKTYLRSLNPRHRWARSSFTDVHDEFRYKTIWVAKIVRGHFGPPDHRAFVALRHSGVRGVRAAAWFLGPTVVYVVERRALWSRRYLRVILGAAKPGDWGPTGSPPALDARDALWVLSDRATP